MNNTNTNKSERISLRLNSKLFEEVKSKKLKQLNKSISNPKVIRQIIKSLAQPSVDKLVNDQGIKEILNHKYKGQDCSMTVRISTEDRTTLEKLRASKSISMNGLISNAMVASLYSEKEIKAHFKQLKVGKRDYNNE